MSSSCCEQNSAEPTLKIPLSSSAENEQDNLINTEILFVLLRDPASLGALYIPGGLTYRHKTYFSIIVSIKVYNLPGAAIVNP